MSKQYQSMQINPRVRHRRLGDEGVVVCMDSGKVLVVNEVATHILEQLSDKRDYSQIVSSITADFAVEEDVASADLECYLGILSEQNIISFAEVSL